MQSTVAPPGSEVGQALPGFGGVPIWFLAGIALVFSPFCHVRARETNRQLPEKKL